MTECNKLVEEIRSYANDLCRGMYNDYVAVGIMLMIKELRELNENLVKISKRIHSDVI